MERIIKSSLGFYKRLNSDDKIEWTQTKAEAMVWSTSMISEELDSGRLSMEFQVIQIISKPIIVNTKSFMITGSNLTVSQNDIIIGELSKLIEKLLDKGVEAISGIITETEGELIEE